MASSFTPTKTVYFFGTCLIDTFFPQAGLAAIRLLKNFGVTVIFPPAQSCCGQPAYNSGFPDEARAVAKKQIRIFPKLLPIVVPSGSCAAMMKYHYPKLFADSPQALAVKSFSDRIVELGQFLHRVLNVQLIDKGPPTTITWHSSCHALREMAVIGDAKALLEQLENVDMVGLERENECCGFGGTFAVKQPAISAAMVTDKIDDIVKTGAEYVISGDSGCLLNIAGAMEKQQIKVKATHLAQFLWERINGSPGPT